MLGLSQLVGRCSSIACRNPNYLFSPFAKAKFMTHIRTPSRNNSNGIISSGHTIVPVVGQTIPEFLFSNLHKWENELAFECGVTGIRYTHLDVYKHSRSFAGALIQRLRKGDFVVILLPNVPEYAAIILGILNAGCVATPFSPTYTVYEIAKQINACKAKAIVTLPPLVPLVREAQKTCPSLKCIIVLSSYMKGCDSFYEMVRAVDYRKTDGIVTRGKDIDTLHDTALLPWSSGTTGSPKGVMLTHSNIVTNTLQTSYPGYVFDKPYEGGNKDEQIRTIGILPFFHSFGLVCIMATTILQGGYMVTLPKFDPRNFVQVIKSHKPTYLPLVAPIISFMVGCPDITREDLKCIKNIFAGAAPVGPTLIHRLLDKAGGSFDFQEGYGMTELSPVSHVTLSAARNTKIGSCGFPLPSTLCKVVDLKTGENLGPNQRGELCVKGPQIMKGYFENEKATAETIDSDGWLHTGDISTYDDDKYFYIVDRLKELIKVNGLQVAPSELEDLLRSHPGVADVGVIGIPNERAGELPRAYIVPKSSTLREEDIHSFIDAKVAPHKKLAGGVEFVKGIPKAPSGKILRRELKKEYMDKLTK